MLDAVLQWRFSSFPVVDLYLLLFSFVSALPGKIASCKNVMKCDVRTYVCMYVCMYVCTAHAPASHSACHDHKKSPAYLLVWVWGSTFAAFGRKGVPLKTVGCGLTVALRSTEMGVCSVKRVTSVIKLSTLILDGIAC